SVFTVLLSRNSDQDEIVVGTPGTGRKYLENEKLIEIFPNSLPLRIVVSGGSTFRQLLHHVRGVTLSASATLSIPFYQLVRDLHLECDSIRTSLFQVMFLLESVAPGPKTRSIASRPSCRPCDTSQFDLTMIAVDAADELRITFEYNA